MNAVPASLFGADGETGALIGVLDTVGPQGASATDLMPWIGIFADDASAFQIGFVKFINIVIRARQVLERNGFWLMRTGGTPSDKYWIEPQGSSS